MLWKPIELHYLNDEGIASPIAGYLSFLRVPFTKKKYTSFSEWNQMKSKFLELNYPLSQPPMIQDPNFANKCFIEPGSIFQHIASKYGKQTGPVSLEELPDFMVVIGAIGDIIKSIMLNSMLFKSPEVLKKKMVGERKRMASRVSALGVTLFSNQWVFGNRVTYGDFLLGFCTQMILKLEKFASCQFIDEAFRNAFELHLNRLKANIKG